MLGKYAQTDFKTIAGSEHCIMLLTETSIKTKNFMIGQILDDGLTKTGILTDIHEAMEFYCDCLKDISDNEFFIIGDSTFTKTNAQEFVKFKSDIALITEENKRKVEERKNYQFSLNRLFN